MRELQHVLRRLRRSPAFTIAATLTLAIAIGATASVFGIVDGVLLKAFPYRDPDRVLEIATSNPSRGVPRSTSSAPNFLDYRAQNTTFTEMAATTLRAMTATGKGEPERLRGLAVTPSYFAVLGVTPILGRGLAPDSGGPAEVVISSEYAQRFGGTVGSTLTLDGRPYTVVGVMPPGLPGDDQVWTRLSFGGGADLNRNADIYVIYGRLKPGVTPARAQSELETIAKRLAATYPESNTGVTVSTRPLLDSLIGAVRPALLMLLAAAACVLLIGSANLANLFLVRHLARERELAVRTALGASRGRLIRDLLLEALTIGAVGCALGVALAYGGVGALRTLAPANVPRVDEIGVDWRVVLFSALATLLTVLVFGMLPAWRASRGDVAGVVKEGGRGTGPVRHHRLQNALVVVQVAMALVILTGAGLFVESFERFQQMNPGFQPEGVLTAQLPMPADPAKQTVFTTAVLERVTNLPGVRAASMSGNLPSGPYVLGIQFTIAGDPEPDPGHVPVADVMCVSPAFFHTMGITLQRGRGILPTDDSRARPVVVVDERLAGKYLAGRDPLAQRLAFGPGDTEAVVGVVAPVKQRGLAEQDTPVVYASLAQCPSPFAFLEVRTAGNPAALAAAVRRAVFDIDPTVPVFDVQAMTARVAQTVGTTRFSTFLTTLFAVVALVLGVVGIYSVLSYVVAQRRREIGVRLALGATHGHVVADVIRRAMALTTVGIGLGAAGAWWVTRTLSGLFLGVSPHDPLAFVGAAVLFVVVALVAAGVPAFRTTRINPAVVLT